MADTENIARELEDAGWPSVADDVREGVPLDTVLKRLREIGEGDGEATEIIQCKDVTTTDERLARELEEAGHDPCFVAEAQAQMQDAMDEMGCS